MPVAVLGVPPEVVSVWGGDPAPITLSVPRQDEQSPGTPRRGFGQERAERGAGQRGEREGRETGGGGLPCLIPWAQPAPPAPLCWFFWDAVQGEVCSNCTFVLLRSQAGPCRSRLCTLGTVTGLKKVGESPSQLGPLRGRQAWEHVLMRDISLGGDMGGTGLGGPKAPLMLRDGSKTLAPTP